ncbi:MAG: hypothetical protein ACXU82_17390 [Caulobacteraceae bacterium]
MGDVVLIDNDIVLKTCCYDLSAEVMGILAPSSDKLAVLGAAPYVLRDRVKRSKRIANVARVMATLEAFLGQVSKLEPDDAEIGLAAEFEAYAQDVGTQLDTGESLLLAALVKRSAHALLTGDKRAIEAVAQIVAALTLEPQVNGRIACLEQLFTQLVDAIGIDQLATRIRQEPLADQVLAICFRCASGKVTAEEARECLASYIADLRGRSAMVLHPAPPGSLGIA